MTNIFKPKRSNTASSVPTIGDLIDGELAINSIDKKIYVRDGSNVVVVATGSQTLDTTLGFGNTSSLGMSVGVVTATDFNSASDIRLKENIQKIDNPIDKIVKIDGVRFDWKSDNKPSMGVIAQNIEEVLPELVNGEDSKSVNYNGIIGLLIECVKTQQEQIDELNKRLDELPKKRTRKSSK
jgi:hypothetical protein